MRIVVDARSVAPGSRLGLAARGLARRGHAVAWLGGPAPEPRDGVPLASPQALRAAAPELLLAGGGPARAALLAWRLHAHGILLATSAASQARWTVLDRLGWESTPATTFLDEADADDIRRRAADLGLERFALWPAGGPPVAAEVTHGDVDVLERGGERLLARRAGPRLRPAAFVDRDGTLVVERGYLSDPDDIELLPGVAGALRALQGAGIPVIVVSNQSGVGRGKFPLSRVYEAMARLRVALRAEGVELDAVRFCPHAPEAGCSCRKPGPALLEEAAADLGLSLRGSVMIGDKRLDAATGQAAGGFGVLVRTGYGRDEEVLAADGRFPRPPDAVFDTLADAARWIITRDEARFEG